MDGYRRHGDALTLQPSIAPVWNTSARPALAPLINLSPRCVRPCVPPKTTLIAPASDTRPMFSRGEPTAADGALVPQIGHLMRATGKPIALELDLEIAPIATRFPSIAAWWDRCSALPGFERTYPPHWR